MRRVSSRSRSVLLAGLLGLAAGAACSDSNGPTSFYQSLALYRSLELRADLAQTVLTIPFDAALRFRLVARNVSPRTVTFRPVCNVAPYFRVYHDGRVLEGPYDGVFGCPELYYDGWPVHLAPGDSIVREATWFPRYQDETGLYWWREPGIYHIEPRIGSAAGLLVAGRRQRVEVRYLDAR